MSGGFYLHDGQSHSWLSGTIGAEPPEPCVVQKKILGQRESTSGGSS